MYMSQLPLIVRVVEGVPMGPPRTRQNQFFSKLLHILLMIFDVTKISLSAFGLQGPKSNMAATGVGGRANFFPITPILVILVSKV